MIVYWLMFLLPALGVLAQGNSRQSVPRYGSWLTWGTVWLALTLLIGWRYEVGGDWFNYLAHFDYISTYSLRDAIQLHDPAHGALNWLAGYMDWGVYGVNLIYAAIFSAGLVAFCRRQPRPMLALLVAIPYLVIVVAMGYSRQGVAIGLALFALLALAERNAFKFVLYVFIAAAFHKTAVVLVPIAALASSRNRVWTAVWVSVTGVLMYVLYLQDSVDTLVENYIEAEYASEGGAIRVAMNAVPAAVFLLFRKRFGLDQETEKLWTWMALIALALVAAFMVSPSSTAVDRIALYFIPVQLFVLSRLPDAMGRQTAGLFAVGVVCYLAAVEFVWLNYGAHAQYWLPYQFYPLVD